MRAAVVVLALAAPAFAAGDAARGERVFQLCAACHAAGRGETNAQAPVLAALVEGRIAAREDFEYSPALRALAQRERTWREDLLDRYLAAPYRVVPKTSMGFPGLPDAQERADVIAYLRTLR